MRVGTRLVLICLVFSAVALSLFAFYGRRATADRPASGPLAAARELVVADNTTVGLLGGIEQLTPITERATPGGGQSITAAVTGGRGDGTLYADVVERNGSWVVVRALLVLADGTRLPLRGPSPLMAPSATGRTPPTRP